MSIGVEADPAHPAGHALIRVPGAAAAADRPGFRIQRDAGWGDDKLGPDGWQGSDALLQPDRAEAIAADLVLHLGWSVCRHMEAGVFELSLPAAGLAQVGLLWPDIAPLHSGVSGALAPAGRSKAAAANAEAPPPQPSSTPRPTPISKPALIPPAAPVVAPVAPEPPQPAPGPDLLKGAIFAASLGVLLLVAGVGTYYWRGRPPVETEAGSPNAPASARLGALSVVEVLARAPNAAAITAEGERRLRAEKRDDGLLLLEAAADRADPAAAAALARLYDPVLFQPGGAIPRPDPRQAARYYRDAARGGVDVAAARAALQRNLQSRAQAGDLGADLSLKDFWP